MYIIRCREDNTVLDTFSTYDEALKALNEYEDIDRKNGCFEPLFYEIVCHEYVVCKRTTELKTAGAFAPMSEEHLKNAIFQTLEKKGDYTPYKTKSFDTLEQATEYCNRINLSYKFNSYGGFKYLTVDEKWIESYIYYVEYEDFILSDITGYEVPEIDYTKQ